VHLAEPRPHDEPAIGHAPPRIGDAGDDSASLRRRMAPPESLGSDQRQRDIDEDNAMP